MANMNAKLFYYRLVSKLHQKKWASVKIKYLMTKYKYRFFMLKEDSQSIHQFRGLGHTDRLLKFTTALQIRRLMGYCPVVAW